MIGRLHHVVIDCPDPAALAQFYAELLGLHVTYRSADWVVVAENDTSSGLAIELAPDHEPPQWPDPDRPQQFHLDVMVEDTATAGARVLALGARRLSVDGVYADPADHPFCSSAVRDGHRPSPGSETCRERLHGAIALSAQDPRPPNARALQGRALARHPKAAAVVHRARPTG